MTSDPARWPGRWLSGAPSPAPRSGAGGQGEIAGPALMVRLPVRDEYEAWMSQLPHNITSVTPGAKHSGLPRLIRVLRLIGCVRVPPINREAPINRDNQHAYPAKRTKALRWSRDTPSDRLMGLLHPGLAAGMPHARDLPRSCRYARAHLVPVSNPWPRSRAGTGICGEDRGFGEDLVHPRPPDPPRNPDPPRRNRRSFRLA
jgi:hypothetical protein